MTATRTQPVSITGLAIAVAIALVGWLAFAQPVDAHGNGSSEQCSMGIEVGGNQNTVTFPAPAGQVITGVCIKSGANMFGGAGHSSVLGSGTHGCYTVAIASDGSSVTVTRNGDGPNCQGISHIDVITAAAGGGGGGDNGGGGTGGGGTGGTGGAGTGGSTGGSTGGTSGGTAGGVLGNQGGPRGAVLGSQGGPAGGTMPNTAVPPSDLTTALGAALLAMSAASSVVARRFGR